MGGGGEREEREGRKYTNIQDKITYVYIGRWGEGGRERREKGESIPIGEYDYQTLST